VHSKTTNYSSKHFTPPTEEQDTQSATHCKPSPSIPPLRPNIPPPSRSYRIDILLSDPRNLPQREEGSEQVSQMEVDGSFPSQPLHNPQTSAEEKRERERRS
jgi:hypothetical protein